MGETLFTPAAVLELLTNIEELKDVPISLSEPSGNSINIQVGNNTYQIMLNSALKCVMDKDTVDVIEDEADSAFATLAENDDIVVEDPVEGGLIKGIVKSLLLGGLIRAVPKLIK